ncbi:type I secretion system permease/ATPase, partial [Escherichia coli]|nr:type I secretion system permease/ATPase [Escherichia coli]
ARLVAIARPVRSVPDSRVDDYIKPHYKGWFLKAVLPDLKPYGYVLVASVIANILTLTGIIFSTQVYDRVIPAESFPTLYVLLGGVVIALAFDYALRVLRTKVVDILGKSADMRLSDLVFGHAIRVQAQRRPKSTGTLIAQLRDLEAVREALTSTTVTTLVDLPFFLLFLGVYYTLGGYLVLAPIVALIAMIIPGLLAQPKIREASSEANREASLRNALLVEAVQGSEDLKTLQAESWFQNKWNNYNSVAGAAQLRMRGIVGKLSTWAHTVQSALYVLVIAIGVPMVIDGEMTTGVLVGLSILGSRMMGPLANVAQLLNRIQQAKLSFTAIDSVMRLPVDHPDDERRIHLPAIAGDFVIKSAYFRYGDENS